MMRFPSQTTMSKQDFQDSQINKCVIKLTVYVNLHNNEIRTEIRTEILQIKTLAGNTQNNWKQAGGAFKSLFGKFKNSMPFTSHCLDEMTDYILPCIRSWYNDEETTIWSLPLYTIGDVIFAFFAMFPTMWFAVGSFIGPIVDLCKILFNPKTNPNEKKDEIAQFATSNTQLNKENVVKVVGPFIDDLNNQKNGGGHVKRLNKWISTGKRITTGGLSRIVYVNATLTNERRIRRLNKTSRTYTFVKFKTIGNCKCHG